MTKAAASIPTAKTRTRMLVHRQRVRSVAVSTRSRARLKRRLALPAVGWIAVSRLGVAQLETTVEIGVLRVQLEATGTELAMLYD